MLETKVLTLSPSNEEYVINLFSHFAWNLHSSQEINVKSSRLELRGDTTYCVTEQDIYVKAILQRDMKIANYDKIVTLEKTYFDAMSRKPSEENVEVNIRTAIILFLFGIIPGVIYLIYKLKKKMRANKSYYELLTAWQNTYGREAEKALAEAIELF